MWAAVRHGHARRWNNAPRVWWSRRGALRVMKDSKVNAAVAGVSLMQVKGAILHRMPWATRQVPVRCDAHWMVGRLEGWRHLVSSRRHRWGRLRGNKLYRRVLGYDRAWQSAFKLKELVHNKNKAYLGCAWLRPGLRPSLDREAGPAAQERFPEQLEQRELLDLVAARRSWSKVHLDQERGVQWRRA